MAASTPSVLPHSYFTRSKRTFDFDVASPADLTSSNPYSKPYTKKIINQKTAAYKELPKKERKTPRQEEPKGYGWSTDPKEDAELAALFGPEWEEPQPDMFMPVGADFLTYNYDPMATWWAPTNSSAAYNELSSFNKAWFDDAPPAKYSRIGDADEMLF